MSDDAPRPIDASRANPRPRVRPAPSPDSVGEAIWRYIAATCGALLLGHLLAGNVGLAVGALVILAILLEEIWRCRRRGRAS